MKLLIFYIRSILVPYRFLLLGVLIYPYSGHARSQNKLATLNKGIYLNSLTYQEQRLKPYHSSFSDSIKTDSSAFNNKKESIKKFTDESEKLLLTTGFLLKSYIITVENVATGKTLRLDPTGSVNLSFGFNYKWFGLAFSFGLPTSPNDKARFGETKKQDFQLNMYTSAFLIQGHLQHYRGFHATNLKSGPKAKVKAFNKSPIIPELEIYSIGVSSWYFFNHKKFSYKAAYVRNAIQKKNAGSVIGGVFYSLDVANAKTTIANNLPDSIKVDFNLVGYRSRSFGVSAGYTYTFVIKKKFFINATMVPGIGLKNVSLNTEKETYKITDGFTGHLAFNFSMGYEAKHFLYGMRAFTSSRFFEANGFRITPSTNSVLFYVGKRFDVNEILKKK